MELGIKEYLTIKLPLLTNFIFLVQYSTPSSNDDDVIFLHYIFSFHPCLREPLEFPWVHESLGFAFDPILHNHAFFFFFFLHTFLTCMHACGTHYTLCQVSGVVGCSFPVILEPAPWAPSCFTNQKRGPHLFSWLIDRETMVYNSLQFTDTCQHVMKIIDVTPITC